MEQLGSDYAQIQIEGSLKVGLDGIHICVLNRLETIQKIAPRLKP